MTTPIDKRNKKGNLQREEKKVGIWRETEKGDCTTLEKDREKADLIPPSHSSPPFPGDPATLGDHWAPSEFLFSLHQPSL